jgi:hypothetical protein
MTLLVISIALEVAVASSPRSRRCRAVLISSAWR